MFLKFPSFRISSLRYFLYFLLFKYIEHKRHYPIYRLYYKTFMKIRQILLAYAKSFDIKHAKVIFSGIQPTGIPHLGNYLGAVKPWVDLQNSGNYDEVIYSIVDLHALTATEAKKKDNLREQSLEMACALLACGIEPSKALLYKQSQVPEHALLQWVFACNTSLPRLYHLTQWRQKTGITDGKEETNVPAVDVGLFTYPILQAADILLYKATHVPVGEDQVQHLRLTQEIAKKFNNIIIRNSRPFPVPQPLISENSDCSRLHSLRDPTSKMSKSDPDKRSRINLDDKPDDIRMKFRKAVTDMDGTVSFDPEKRPGVSNLIAIHSALSKESIPDIVHKVKQTGLKTGAYKLLVADCVIESLSPIRSKIEDLRRNLDYIEKVLDDCALKARDKASKNWKEISDLLGL